MDTTSVLESLVARAEDGWEYCFVLIHDGTSPLARVYVSMNQDNKTIKLIRSVDPILHADVSMNENKNVQKLFAALPLFVAASMFNNKTPCDWSFVNEPLWGWGVPACQVHQATLKVIDSSQGQCAYDKHGLAREIKRNLENEIHVPSIEEYAYAIGAACLVMCDIGPSLAYNIMVLPSTRLP